MKTIKTIAIAMAALLTASLTSCINDDDDNNQNADYHYLQLTETQQKDLMKKLEGNYENYLYFTNANTQKTDSAQVKWEVNASDSTVTCVNFPVNILRNYVKSDMVKEALDLVGQQPVVFKYSTGNTVVKELYEASSYFFNLTIPNASNIVKFTYGEGEGEKEKYVAIEFADQFIGYSTVYSQMVRLDRGSFFGAVLVSIVDANNVATKVNCIIPFQ